MSDAPIGPDPLETDFRALKARATPPSDDLMARVLADADAVQAEIITPREPKRPSFLLRFTAVIGGWPSLAGLATAGIAGLWIGVSPPAALVQGSQVLLYGDASHAMVDLDPTFGFAASDGGL